MNLLLIEPTDFIDQNTITLDGRRAEHLRQVHKVSVGDSVRAGLINGDIGSAIVEAITPTQITLNARFDRPAPSPLDLTLIIALPRPKMLKRILQTIATMGVKELIFVNSYRVEKSYWQTPLLQPQAIREQLILGLEQGADTALPTVSLVKRFKPFVEDQLPAMARNCRALVAHPRHANSCPPASSEKTLLIIGPEGGFIDYEIEKLAAAGCTPIHLGARILRVETAVPVLLAKLFPI